MHSEERRLRVRRVSVHRTMMHGITVRHAMTTTYRVAEYHRCPSLNSVSFPPLVLVHATMTIEYLTQLFDRTEDEKHTTVQQATEFACAHLRTYFACDVMIFFFATGDAFMTSYINQPRSLRRTAPPLLFVEGQRVES